MKNKIITASILTLALLGILTITSHAEKNPFAPNVDLKTGAISVPENYTKWATLGTWAHAKTEGEPGSKEYHVVYTQPATIEYHQKHGRYPAGWYWSRNF